MTNVRESMFRAPGARAWPTRAKAAFDKFDAAMTAMEMADDNNDADGRIFYLNEAAQHAAIFNAARTVIDS